MRASSYWNDVGNLKPNYEPSTVEGPKEGSELVSKENLNKYKDIHNNMRCVLGQCWRSKIQPKKTWLSPWTSNIPWWCTNTSLDSHIFFQPRKGSKANSEDNTKAVKDLLAFQEAEEFMGA